jgi:hypothetical protein
MCCGCASFILETSVGREKDVQHIDVLGEFEKLMVTLLVMRAFSNFPGASGGCAYFRDPTEVSRIMPETYAEAGIYATVPDSHIHH